MAANRFGNLNVMQHEIAVIVQGVGRSDSAGAPAPAAAMASVRNAQTLRSCCRQVVTTDRTRSTTWLPSSPWVPIHCVRQVTAGRSARSAALLVGSTPMSVTNGQSASHQVSSSWLRPAIVAQRRASGLRRRADGHPDRLHGVLQTRAVDHAVPEGMPGT
jgi:hypothetical protein